MCITPETAIRQRGVTFTNFDNENLYFTLYLLHEYNTRNRRIDDDLPDYHTIQYFKFVCCDNDGRTVSSPSELITWNPKEKIVRNPVEEDSQPFENV